MTRVYVPDPSRDLVLERIVDVPKDLVWRAWTQPEHVMKWFCPLPWTTSHCEIDLRPGGIFRTILRSPEGEEHEHIGCYLEVEKPSRVVWTTALEPGFRPTAAGDSSGVPHFTALITMETVEKGTKYTAIAMHGDAASRNTHEAMGFHDGWGTALDQLVDFARRL